MMPMQMWFGPVGHGSATDSAYLWPEAGVERNMVRNDVIAHSRSPCTVQNSTTYTGARAVYNDARMLIGFSFRFRKLAACKRMRQAR